MIEHTQATPPLAQRLVRAVAVLVGIALVPSAARAQEAPAADATTHVSVEFDPLPLLASGYGGVLSVRPAAMPRWKLGIASYALDYPSFLEDGVNEGFELRAEPSFLVLASRSFSEERGGWFVGGLLRQSRNAFTHEDHPDEVARTQTFELAADGGYVWYPLSERGLFLQFWGSLGVNLVEIGEPTVGDQTFVRQLPVLPYATLHIGYEWPGR